MAPLELESFVNKTQFAEVVKAVARPESVHSLCSAAVNHFVEIADEPEAASEVEILFAGSGAAGIHLAEFVAENLFAEAVVAEAVEMEHYNSPCSEAVRTAIEVADNCQKRN